MWLLNSSQTQVAQWDSDVALGITAVDFRYYVWIAGVQNFLQSDGLTFAPADNTFAGTFTTQWEHMLTVPAAAHDYILEWSATPNLVGDDFSIGEKHYVGPIPDFDFDGFVFNGVM